MTPDQLNRPPLLRCQSQADLFIEIPPRRRQPVLFGLIRRPDSRKKGPVTLWKQLQPAREGKPPVRVREMNINPEGGIEEILSLGEPEDAEFPAVVVESENDRCNDPMRITNPVV